MPDALTYTIEAAVGVACLVAAAATWRRSGLRLVSVAFAAAGLAAVIHAAVSLT